MATVHRRVSFIAGAEDYPSPAMTDAIADDSRDVPRLPGVSPGRGNNVDVIGTGPLLSRVCIQWWICPSYLLVVVIVVVFFVVVVIEYERSDEKFTSRKNGSCDSERE